MSSAPDRSIASRDRRRLRCSAEKSAAHGQPRATLLPGPEPTPAIRCRGPVAGRQIGPGAAGRGTARAGVSRGRDSVPVYLWRRVARSSPGSPHLDRGAPAGDALRSQAGTRAFPSHMDFPMEAIGRSNRVPARVLHFPLAFVSGPAREMKMPSRAEFMPTRHEVQTQQDRRRLSAARPPRARPSRS